MAYTQTQLEPVIGTCLSLVPFQLSLSLCLSLSPLGSFLSFHSIFLVKKIQFISQMTVRLSTLLGGHGEPQQHALVMIEPKDQLARRLFFEEGKEKQDEKGKDEEEEKEEDTNAADAGDEEQEGEDTALDAVIEDGLDTEVNNTVGLVDLVDKNYTEGDEIDEGVGDMDMPIEVDEDGSMEPPETAEEEDGDSQQKEQGEEGEEEEQEEAPQDDDNQEEAPQDDDNQEEAPQDDDNQEEENDDQASPAPTVPAPSPTTPVTTLHPLPTLPPKAQSTDNDCNGLVCQHPLFIYSVLAFLPLLAIFLCRKYCCAKKEDSRGQYRAVAAQYGDMSFDNTFSDTFSDEGDDTYDEDGDVEESWGKSGGKRVLEMSSIKNSNGSQNGIGGEDGLSLEEMNG